MCFLDFVVGERGFRANVETIEKGMFSDFELYIGRFQIS